MKNSGLVQLANMIASELKETVFLMEMNREQLKVLIRNRKKTE